MKFVKPSATLITHTAKPIETIYQAFKVCVTPFGEIEIPERGKMESFITKRLKAEHPHESTLEHVSFTFMIVCSRSASHQLVRHRLASYSQQSQRYVEYEDIDMIFPESLQGNARMMATDRMRGIEELYTAMTCDGVAAEDARAVLPNATATRLLVTMNVRQLRHFFTERLCRRAQEEIRSIAWQMLTQCRKALPCAFNGIAEPCVKSGHCVEERPCGHQPWKVVYHAEP